ncbi:MAG: CsgG/HfaB family protein [Bacteroidales bacterium]|nr:CsgG/HfaB family protein [Candidatus Latescibacterota bacterium]
MRRIFLFFISFSLLILSPIHFMTPDSGALASESGVSEQLAKAVDVYLDGEFEAGLAITNELLSRQDLTANDEIAILEVKSIITYAKGQKYKNEAYSYLQNISQIGHCLINLPREMWPSELRDKWYELCQSKNLLVCPDDRAPEIKTIAIMEFDNFSIGKYKKELGDISKALADFFEYDFSRFTDLKIVERDKLDYLLREIKLSEEGKIDQATAVRVGKMLGAQLMVFGSIAQVDRKNARMVVRVVNVETSEIITSADMEGKPNFVEMEKGLVKAIAEKLELVVTDQMKTAIEESATTDMDAAKLYSLGLKYMDDYQYEKAYEHFQQAYEKDNTFVEAKKKMEIYKPLIG